MIFIDSNYDSTEYYRLMKTRVAGNRWHDFVEKLVSDIKKNGRWTNKKETRVNFTLEYRTRVIIRIFYLRSENMGNYCLCSK